MKLYRFSPIVNKAQLLKAVKYTHFACHKLCKQSFGKYLPVAGDIGIFCHYDKEYKFLTKLREKLTDSRDSFNQRYFRLHKPIVIPAKGKIPKTEYTFLYIRRPDPYRHQVGDVDFFLEQDKHSKLKNSLIKENKLKGARVYQSTELNMIELYNPDIDALAYICTWKMKPKNYVN